MALLRPEIRNPHLDDLEVDYLYHFFLDSGMDLKRMFGDVKFVCMGGSGARARGFAEKAAQELEIEIPEGGLQPIGKTERFELYKIGPVISVSHGMGMPSASINVNEVAKLLDYAGCEDVKFIRIGTSGGIGVEPGTVVITDEALNGELKPVYESIQLGNRREYPTQLDTALTNEIFDCRGAILAVIGKTIGADGFYEEQGRLDGALRPEYTEVEKMTFLDRAHAAGVRNFEMEAPLIASFFRRAGLAAAVVNTTLLNRLEGDQVTSTPEQLGEFSDRAQQVVINYLRKKLKEVTQAAQQ